MSGDVHSGIAVENIVVNDAVGCNAAVLPPNVQSIMMVRIGSGIPLHIIMDVVVVYRKARIRALRAESQAMIDVVDVGIRQREVVSVPGEGPACIMAGHMSNCNIVRIEPVDTVYGRLPHRKIRYRRADVKDLAVRQTAVNCVYWLNSNNI